MEEADTVEQEVPGDTMAVEEADTVLLEKAGMGLKLVVEPAVMVESELVVGAVPLAVPAEMAS